MADFETALQKTLSNEGGFFRNTVTGEVVNQGITHWFLRDIGVLKGTGPASPEEILFIRNLSDDTVFTLYRDYFWFPGGFFRLKEQQLANKTFDLSVNTGLRTGIKFLQGGINTAHPYGTTLILDGLMGPKTLQVLDDCREGIVYLGLLQAAQTYYGEVAKNHPEKANNLEPWLDRLGRV